MPLSEVILATVGLLAIAMVVAGLCRRLPIPYTVLLVIVGVAIREVAPHWSWLAALSSFSLTPDLVFFVFLPALIFESGYNLNARQLLRDLGPILTLAVPALLISTAIVGLGVWFLMDIPLIVALLFGALISATDPVAVISLFKELGAPVRLTVLVEGESLLNDATAIVLFGILLGLAVQGASFDSSVVGSAFFNFFIVFFGGALVGALTGLFISEVQHRLQSSATAIVSFSIITAYAAFIFAEHILHVSGVMAAVGAAVTLASLGILRMPEETSHTLTETWELIAHIANSLLFLMVGMSLDIGSLWNLAGNIAVAVVLVIAARAASVYTMVPLTTKLFSLPEIAMSDRHIMWWGGLKGGLAIAIVLSIPESLVHRPLLINLTLGVVIFTLLVNAPTIRPLMSWLGLDKLTDEEKADLEGMRQRAQESGSDLIERLHDAEVVSRAACHRARQMLADTLTSTEERAAENFTGKELHLEAARAESEMLRRCYEIRLIRQYTYLDLRSLLRASGEEGRSQRSAAGGQGPGSNRFLRFELWILQALREKTWATGLLTRYQSMRLTQHLERNIAGLLMAEAAISRLCDESLTAEPDSHSLMDEYRARVDRRRQRLHSVAKDFPMFYRRFEARLLNQVTYAQARRTLGKGLQRGEISAKAFSDLDRRIAQALEDIPSIGVNLPQPRAEDLFRAVPLLEELPSRSLEQLIKRAQSLTFLPGDTVIKEGDRGHALYLIAHGTLRVSRKTSSGEETIARLTDGDFFGEMALLDDQVRTATVFAETPCACWRLTRRDVLKIGEQLPELLSALEDKRAKRDASDQA